jgi:hypothetical protein
VLNLKEEKKLVSSQLLLKRVHGKKKEKNMKENPN